MRPALALLVLAQSITIIAAPAKLVGKDLYWEGPEEGARYLTHYGEYGNNGGDGPAKNIEKREAEPEPQVNLSDHYLACYSGYGSGPWTDVDRDRIKRCAKERIKRDPQYSRYSDVYLACYIGYGTEAVQRDEHELEKRCGKPK
ncbi:hypothetical protein N431DRAFT_470086 [Stipitochalara longipes BDJ]|nr:hypothetical protein N431DRAFT_470086 [Stipitochalara longipes BDJ]